MSVSLGPLVLSWGHALFLISYGIALFVGWRVGQHYEVNAEPVLTRTFFTGLFTARLTFVAQYWKEYSADIIGMIDIRDGGFSLIGGISGAALVLSCYLWRQAKLRVTLLIAISSAAAIWLIISVMLEQIQVSQKVPAFVYKNLSGDSVTLDQFNDKPTIVNLWATWCPPCRREMPVFMQAQQTRTNLHFVFINQGEHEGDIKSFLQSEQLNLSNILLDPQQSTMRLLGAQGLPSTLFYNAQGKLSYTHMGELSHASLNHALKKISPDMPEKDESLSQTSLMNLVNYSSMNKPVSR